MSKSLNDYLTHLDLPIPTVLKLKDNPEQALLLIAALERHRTSFNQLIQPVGEEVDVDTIIVRELATELYKKA